MTGLCAGAGGAGELTGLADISQFPRGSSTAGYHSHAFNNMAINKKVPVLIKFKNFPFLAGSFPLLYNQIKLEHIKKRLDELPICFLFTLLVISHLLRLKTNIFTTFFLLFGRQSINQLT